MRTGHGGALKKIVFPLSIHESLLKDAVSITVIVEILGHITARSHKIKSDAPVGIRSQGIVISNRTDCYGCGINCRVRDVLSGVVIAGGADYGNAHVIGMVKGRVQNFIIGNFKARVGAQTHVNDISSVHFPINGPPYPVGNISD